MKTYTVYFSLFSRKIKVDVVANNPVDAYERVKDAIRFERAEVKPNPPS